MKHSGHLRLRPGYVAVRRDDTHLQVGIDPPRRAVLRDTADVRRLLTDLAAGRATRPVPSRTTLPVLRALDALMAADLVVEEASAPPAYGVQVEGPPDLVEPLRSLLGDACRASPTGLAIVVSPRPLQRERLDPLVRAGTPHLVVQGGPDAWTVGPFVVPGVTACLRCVDAHLGEADPRRGVVLEQLARLPGSPDPLGRAQALAWAVADLRGWLAGTTPGTWSASYTLGGAPRRREWLRHPHCGCAWDVLADSPPG